MTEEQDQLLAEKILKAFDRVLVKSREEEKIDWENHPGKKYAYSDFTLKFISDNKHEINKRAKEYGIPSTALAMAIGDELQTRKDTFLKASGWFDRSQDRKANQKQLKDNSDIGIGNIRIATAKKIRGTKGWGLNDLELQRYMLSEKGTVHIAALAMQEVLDVMGPHLEKTNMTDHEYNQHLVEACRQGPYNRIKRRQEGEQKLPKLKEQLNEIILRQEKNKEKDEKALKWAWSSPAAGANSLGIYNATMDDRKRKELEKEVEKYSNPMKTGVDDERSEFRTQQIKWILDGEDKSEYDQEGLRIGPFKKHWEKYTWKGDAL